MTPKGPYNFSMTDKKLVFWYTILVFPPKLETLIDPFYIAKLYLKFLTKVSVLEQNETSIS